MFSRGIERGDWPEMSVPGYFTYFSKEIKQNWTGTENFDNCFRLIFDC